MSDFMIVRAVANALTATKARGGDVRHTTMLTALNKRIFRTHVRLESLYGCRHWAATLLDHCQSANMWVAVASFPGKVVVYQTWSRLGCMPEARELLAKRLGTTVEIRPTFVPTSRATQSSKLALTTVLHGKFPTHLYIPLANRA
jgi:hypothetical protein